MKKLTLFTLVFIALNAYSQTNDTARKKQQALEQMEVVHEMEGGEEEPTTYPRNKYIFLRNCQNVIQTGPFQPGLGFFKNWAVGEGSLEKNKWAKFSKAYTIDSNFLSKNIDVVQKTLPKHFIQAMLSESWYENVPGETGIWFMHIFAQEVVPGQIKIYSAIKITFEGADAKNEANRKDPLIKKVEFITDEKAIQALEIKLKASPRTKFS